MTAKKFMSECIVFACLIMMAAGCSIKEDRVDCPCRLILDMSEAVNYGQVKVNIMASDGSTISTVYNPVAEDSGEQSASEMIIKIPKGAAAVTAVAGDEGKYVDFSGVDIPVGEECPPVFIHNSIADATGEKCEQKISLCKDYCRITVYMANDSQTDYPFGLEVVGDVEGYSYPDEPVAGLFRYAMPSDGTGVFRVNVPRQRGSTLVLRVSEENKVLRSFAIGEYMAQAGYDWEAESLSDVDLYIDYAKADIVFNIEDWEYSFSFDVVI